MSEHPLTIKLRSLLSENNISFEEIDHQEAPTCELSAQARRLDIKYGGKTVLFKGKNGFALFVISAAKEIDSNKVRKILKSQKLRFARFEEFEEITGTVKGALPPFGEPIINLPLYIDESIRLNEKIAFNAGVLTKSFILKMNDYLKLISPVWENFSK